MLPDVPSSMPSFVPRHFPPPALAGVPVEYIIHKLHQLAPNYWDRPDTADCTIIVPIPHPVGRARRAPDMPLFTSGITTPVSPSRHSPNGLGRRATDPVLNVVPRVTFELHVDYLCARSTFLRGLFAGANPIDLINGKLPSIESIQDNDFSVRKEPLPFDVPANRLPRLLPSSPTHPTLFLPVPDPTSFHLLVHWMYFGNTDFIEECLNGRIIQLAGIRRNVEYLGLPDDVIGRFLRRWERGWRKYNLPPSPPYDDESESSDEDEDEYPYSCSSDDDDMDVDMDVDVNFEEEPQRGRTTTARHLLHSSKLETDRPHSA